jgi:butyryl-CoA dehydrogenase
MDFDLTSEQRAIRETAKKFAKQVIEPQAQKLDEEEAFPYDIVRRMAELGFFGLTFPIEYGGVEAGALAFSIVVEEVGHAESAVAINLVAQALVGAGLLLFGTEEHKQRWLVPMAKGQSLGAFGLTEPDAGSDSGATKTKATLDDDHWVINGSKQFITNAGTDITSLVLITAKTADSAIKDSSEISMLLIPAETPGFVVGPPYKKMGWRCSDTRPLTFENCRIPKENLLGEKGRGLAHMLKMLDIGRIGVAADSLGLAQACYDAAAKYAKVREQFGQPICKFQAIQFKLADMAVEIELARLMTYKAAWLYDQGRPNAMEGDMAKLYASETAKRAADQAVQIHGGYGFTNEYAVSRFWRTVKIMEIGEGTNEIQRLVIARRLGFAD